MSFARQSHPSTASNHVASLSWRTWLAVAAMVVLSGCRSASSTDLVERELRHQEDQIYALEDYLTEYQQMLCDARAENVALKRRLVQGQFRDSPPEDLAEPGRAQPTPPRRSPTPPSRQRDDAPVDDTEPVLPDVPPLEFDVPDVPSLDETSAHEYDEMDGDVLAEDAALAETPVIAADAVGSRQPPSTLDDLPRQVTLRGEVILDDPDAGPRVWVDVTPLSADGRPTAFRGSLSLMILDSPSDVPAADIARWDFAPDDMARIAGAAADGATLEFPLQLPADVPTDRPLEFWVRLLPDDGGKVLAHAELDLSRPGQFASAEAPPRPTVDHAVRTAAAEAPIIHRRSTTAPDEDGWEIARPGGAVEFARRSDSSDGTWRTATQPIPTVESRPVASFLSPPATPLPDRGSLDDTVRRRSIPAWSPTR